MTTVALIRENVSTLVLITPSHNRKAVSQQKEGKDSQISVGDI